MVLDNLRAKLWDCINKAGFALKALGDKFCLSGKSRQINFLAKGAITVYAGARLCEPCRYLAGHHMLRVGWVSSAPPSGLTAAPWLVCWRISWLPRQGPRHMCFGSLFMEPASEALTSCNLACKFLLSHLTSWIF